MARRRSFIAGMTDYTGVPLADMIQHLREWHEQTAATLSKLATLRDRVIQESGKLQFADEVTAYIGFFQDLFERYRGDLARLAEELPMGVREAHVEIVRQLSMSSDHEDSMCVRFKRDHIELDLKDESVRPLLDEIYAETKSIIISYRDLSNLVPRLRTFVGVAQPLRPNEVFQVKPGLWGVSVDLKQLMHRIRVWWSARGKGRS